MPPLLLRPFDYCPLLESVVSVRSDARSLVSDRTAAVFDQLMADPASKSALYSSTSESLPQSIES